MAAAADAAVLVGVSSERTFPAVRVAAREAALHQRPLLLLHAFDWDSAFEAPSVVGPRAQAEELVSRAAAVANECEPALPVGAEIVEGSAVTTLVRRSVSAFLVAVGDSGMAGHDHRVFADAPAVQIAARADCPVLVARHEPPPLGPVLVGVDGSHLSRLALRWAFDCASRRRSRLLAVRVVERGETDEQATDRLARIVADCAGRHQDVAVECHAIHGEPGHVLVDQSRSAQVAVVAARGDEPRRGMLGAVAQSLLYHSPAPVMVVRGLVNGAQQPG
ncbi:Nucleotide-binding universal stress protein, UspA family [Micromonospora nigra]|uniref:Nucleotide-binding universal stress protein, UspA family n=1 Tax=Micromonospora nigra TaxID=145857 RepID=A0A1C6SQ80_9ACTN|nr:universal stress protein [Micromonospora nigra]SCL31637.1 Nucleotide-binding universal stress protein, UspA family [Micromonospora nigra]